MEERCSSLNDKLFSFLFAGLALVDGVEIVKHKSIMNNIITNIELVIILKVGRKELILCFLAPAPSYLSLYIRRRFRNKQILYT